MKEETISVWLEVSLRQLRDFKNPYFAQGGVGLQRVTQIRTTEHFKLRPWREYFFQYSTYSNGGTGPNPLNNS